MSNNSTWPSPDQQVAGQGRQDVHGTYLLDPNTQKATAPGAGTQYKDGDATSANPVGTMPVFDNAGTISHVSVANPLPVSATVTPAANQRVSAHVGDFVDGADVTIGLKSDAAVTDSTTTNTHMSFIKGLVKILADAWDSGNHWLQVKVMNGNPNGQATSANSAPIVIASDQIVPSNTKQINGTTTSVNAGNRDAGTQRFIEAGNGTGTVTQVASSATSGAILAANTNKKGTLFYNDSTQILYLLYGTGVVTPTNYSVKIGSQAYFEDPLHYTGGFNGIWAAANGFVYATEVS